MTRRVLLPMFVLASVGCAPEPSPVAPAPPASPAAPAETAPPPPVNDAEVVPAPQDGRPVRDRVREAVAEASGEARRVVVYVGAPWCEPCRRFHDAVLEGRLHDPFPGVRFLEFDLDVDGERLREDGYASRLVPLFVVPGEDGRATSRRTEGGVKGDGAVPDLVPRIRRILDGRS